MVSGIVSTGRLNGPPLPEFGQPEYEESFPTELHNLVKCAVIATCKLVGDEDFDAN